MTTFPKMYIIPKQTLMDKTIQPKSSPLLFPATYYVPLQKCIKLCKLCSLHMPFISSTWRNNTHMSRAGKAAVIYQDREILIWVLTAVISNKPLNGQNLTQDLEIHTHTHALSAAHTC